VSNIIPGSVAEARRANTDKLVEYVGLDCILYKVESREGDKLDDNPTIVYAPGIDTQVQIMWTPEIRLLKELGLYTEEKAPLPILAYFKYEDDPKPGDYIELEYEYAVGSSKTNRFAVVDRRVLGHGEEVVDVWQIAPLRSTPS
jgi:hypothetical protein